MTPDEFKKRAREMGIQSESKAGDLIGAFLADKTPRAAFNWGWGGLLTVEMVAFVLYYLVRG